MEGLWQGSAARQGHHLPTVQPTRGEPLCTGSQPAWKHWGHLETQGLLKGQQGHGRNTCSDLFSGLGPYLRENRSLESTSRTTKWLTRRQEAQGIHRPAQQTLRAQRLCPEDKEALVNCLRQKREELEGLEEKVYEGKLRATSSSLDHNQSAVRSMCILRDPPSLMLEPAAGPSVWHSARSVTKGAAGGTPKYSERVSLDQLLAELSPVSDDSLACDALVKELLENWEPEELPDRDAAEERDSEPQSALFVQAENKEGHVLKDGSSVTPEVAAGSQVPHTTLGVTKVSAGEAENSTAMAPPAPLADLCSDSSLSCDALLNKLLQKWEEEKSPEREGAGESNSEPDRDSEPDQAQDGEAEPAASELDSHPCSEGHSEPLPTAPLGETKVFAVWVSPANAADEADTAWVEACHAQATPGQEKPCKAELPAGACLEPAQSLPHHVPACPAGSADVPQPPAPRRWPSMVKRARRAVRRLFSFSCLRGQPEE
ncbi:hypothetical protein DUI87_06928 [Hirundo rustica rustica]|uniref:Uncharacterized protein n=1 Tax=Hirundo rustica rustica TaxID=333673 RepID=A0A3M0KTM9_HIRRU|nr:hypothetical protein DUI87_06928 [Hirundo rustica rustica]